MYDCAMACLLCCSLRPSVYWNCGCVVAIGSFAKISRFCWDLIEELLMGDGAKCVVGTYGLLMEFSWRIFGSSH